MMIEDNDKLPPGGAPFDSDVIRTAGRRPLDWSAWPLTYYRDALAPMRGFA